ncbi:TPA: hypothetical protein L5U90_003433 [Pseudomonas aeruginosa]|nr:hypothetical protein [Pseudomonas aeruginosa]
MLALAALGLPLLAGNAYGIGGAAAIAAAAGGSKSDEDMMSAGGPVAGATGYVFVDGVGWRDAVMIYCPPSVGHITTDRLRWAAQNEISEGKCGQHAVISAQEYVDQLIGKNKAVVLSVAPVMGRYSTFGLIYYRAVTEGE